MLTVWTICWGDKYSDYYVQRLQREVRKNLSLPHEFVCITDRVIDGVITMPFPEDYPGWWSKVALFKPGVGSGQNLWLDLDVVITGSLDPLIEQYGRCPLAMPLNWAQSGHGGCQSSVMVWADNLMAHKIYHLFDPADIHWPPTPPWKYYGDQEWITHLRDTQEIRVVPIRSDWIRSYKYHCTNGPPENTKIVCFHGTPKPPDLKTDWFTW